MPDVPAPKTPSEPAPTPAGPARLQRKTGASADRKRTRSLWLKRVFMLLAALAIAGLLVLAFLPKPVRVDVGQVARTELRVVVLEDGKTRVKDRYVVSSPLLANLARIELKVGDPVTTDTVIARLMPLPAPLLDPQSRAQASAQVDAAQAAERQAHAAIARVRTGAELAEREAIRLRALHAQGAASDQALEQAELQARSAREELASAELSAQVADHQLALARAALGMWGRNGKGETQPMEVQAPLNGRVLRILHESEGVVSPGTPLIEIGDPAALEVVVDVLTSDAVRLQPGAHAFIERWGGDAALPAHVRLIEPSAFTRLSALGVEEQRVNVVLDLDAPREQWAQLGDGYRVEARIVVWEGKDVLTAPLSAAFRQADGYAVYRVESDAAVLTPIEVGRRNDERIEVLESLPAGTAVVLHPSDRIANGTRIERR